MSAILLSFASMLRCKRIVIVAARTAFDTLPRKQNRIRLSRYKLGDNLLGSAGLKDPKRAFQLTAVARQVGAILVSILIVKVGWSTGDVGVFEQWFFIGSVLSFALVIGVLQGYLAMVSDLERPARRALAGTCYLFLMSLLAIATVALMIGDQLFIPLLLGTEVVPSNIKLALLFFFLHLGSTMVVYVFLVEHQSAKLLLRYALAYPIILLTSVLAGIKGIGGLDGAIVGLLVFAVLEQILCIGVLLDLQALRGRRAFVSKLWTRSWPLCLYALLGALGLLFDGWLVNRYYQDSSVFALFRYGAREFPGSLALAGAFGAAMLPMLVKDSNKGLFRIKLGAKRLMHFFLPLAALLMVFSQSLYRMFYNTSYNESAYIFMIYLFLLLSRWIFGHTIMIAKGKERVLVLFSIIEVVVNIGLSVTWVASYGLPGIALATVVAYSLEKVLIAIYLWIKFEIAPTRYVPIATLCGYLILLAVVFFLTKP